MKVSFHPSAKEELIQSFEYYEQIQDGLGIEFMREVRRTVTLIAQYPLAWPVLSKNSHRCLVNRFPFGLIYRIHDNEIQIIAAMQMNKKPGYWKER